MIRVAPLLVELDDLIDDLDAGEAAAPPCRFSSADHLLVHLAHGASLTRRLTTIGKSTSGSGSDQQGAEGDHGVRIITLAGDNKGATMKAGTEEALNTEGMLYGDELMMSAYTNSNYQAVNNSIMLGGSCHAEDPGVHVMITDYMEDDDDEDMKEKKDKEKKEKKDKERKRNGRRMGRSLCGRRRGGCLIWPRRGRRMGRGRIGGGTRWGGR